MMAPTSFVCPTNITDTGLSTSQFNPTPRPSEVPSPSDTASGIQRAQQTLALTPEQEQFISTGSAPLGQHHDLLLQRLRGEQDPPHGRVQLLQRQLRVQDGGGVALGCHHELQQAVQVPQHVLQHLGTAGRGSSAPACTAPRRVPAGAGLPLPPGHRSLGFPPPAVTQFPHRPAARCGDPWAQGMPGSWLRGFPWGTGCFLHGS